MTWTTLTLATCDRGIARLTLDRPDRHNALDAAMSDALTEAAAQIEADPAIRVVVLTGAGRSFCAGGDLDWMRAQLGATRATRVAEARRIADMFHALNTLSKPLIARVAGAAYGGGVGLMALSDAVIAAEDARFGLTETRLGLIPATIAPYVVARIGEGAARRAMLSARSFGADEARAMGLVTRVVPQDGLDAAVEAEIEPYFATAPAAVAAAKRLARSLGPPIDAAVISDTIERLADTWETPEARAGIAAFFAREPAPWIR